MRIKAKDVQPGDELVGAGVVTRVATHGDYKPAKPSYAGRHRPRTTTCPPFKPVPVVEIRVDGREAPIYKFPREHVEVERQEVAA